MITLGFALWLRIESSQLRLFHADEGVQSYQAWRLIETGEYRYDPTEHHGPLLYYLTDWFSSLLVDDSAELNDASMRWIPIGASILGLALGLFALGRKQKGRALVWGLLIAASPLCVIYGAYYIQEAILVSLTLALFLTLQLYLKKNSIGPAILAGLLFGLMHVTKETAVIHLFALASSVVCIRWIQGDLSKVFRVSSLLHLSLATGIVVALHCIFFSSFFENPAGISDGIKAFFNYAERSEGAGHEKPFFYYLEILSPQTVEGVKWGEGVFLLLCVYGSFLLLRRVKVDALGASICLSGWVMLLLYSLIPYKTPWLLLTPYLFLSYGVATAVADTIKLFFQEECWVRKLAVGILGFTILSLLGWELRGNLEKAVFRYASASRNPYLYMHTSPRYEKLLERIDSVGDDVSISVVSPDAAWPLPWHLRTRTKVGFWSDLEGYRTGRVDIIDTRLLDANQLNGEIGEFWELHGLRPNTLLALRADPEVARLWIQADVEDQ
ncbi:glycosyltransferase family 39 protein [Pelagicoccus albus]|uniref:Glycosyltransferase family 39 protein n=1 Tax=Pelagicoccus albus TaxID=415222 RepID=A0A7X1EAL4_9BACT|nr:glycosyltransferase family 39 protein [Pelagicoccus albus]MBC2606892.1 glycosyltransferase family 39 protein [Pelagicoccus albus]